MVTTAKSEKSSAKGKAASKSKKAAKKKAPAKEAAKGAQRETVRVRALKTLAKGKELTAHAIQEVIGLGHGLKPTMDQEVERGHLKASVYEADAKKGISPGTYYRITPAGKKSLEAGTVNPKRNAE